MATQTKTIYEALANIQAKLSVPKTHFNKFGGYSFRNTSDILDAVKPLAMAEGCNVAISDDIVMIGTRIYIKATATLSNAKGESISTTAYAREEETKKGMDASQVTGAASSYARKYALNGLFAIDDTADADQLNTSKAYTEKPKTTAKAEATSIEAAKVAADQVKNRAEFAVWWSKYPTLQGDEDFLTIAKELGDKFPRK